MFEVLEEKAFAVPVEPRLMRWCPTMDLVAVVPKSQGAIWVHRLSGQRVWSASLKKGQADPPADLVWKYDGKALAVIYEDGSWVLLNSSNGRALATTGMDVDRVTTLSWVEYKGSQQQPDVRIHGVSLRSIIDVDLTKHMPKLPSLPSNFQAFTTISLEDMPPVLDLLLTGTDNGSLGVNVYGVFSIGTIRVSKERVVAVASNASLSRYLVVVKGLTGEYSLIQCHSTFIEKFGQNYLPEVSIIPARVLALLSYIKEAVQLLKTETIALTRHTDAALSRLSADRVTWECALMDTLVTGIPLPEVEHWLKEDLTERGLRKWHKTVIGSYESSRKLLFENLVPACERLIVLLSRLRGLAKWRERGEPLGLDPDKFDSAMERAEKLLELASGNMWKLKDEYHLFRMFVTWMDVLFEDLPDVTVSQKALGDDPSTVKTVDVADFITDHLNESVVKKLFDQEPGMDVLTDSLIDACEDAFSKIRQATYKQFRSDAPVRLGSSNNQTLLRYNENADYFYVLTYELEGQTLQLLRVPDGSGDQATATISLSGRVLQAEFIDDTAAIVLMSTDDDTKVLASIDYVTGPSYSAIAGEAQEVRPLAEQSLDRDDCDAVAFAVNGAESRRVGILLDRELQKYQFFDLGNSRGGGAEKMDED
ncbi:hypothetical protein TRVA0_001S03598 [Trichomonascus vanleenenianus]|uniref:anaphase promoting complex subunit 4 n=1 Tax=Trichomonascus vanleenenianus TaxID=2268995 RepID=UPI003EC97C4E